MRYEVENINELDERTLRRKEGKVVYYSLNDAHIEDIFVNGDYDYNSGDGILDLQIKLGFDLNKFLPHDSIVYMADGPENEFYIHAVLSDNNNRKIFDETVRFSPFFREENSKV